MLEGYKGKRRDFGDPIDPFTFRNLTDDYFAETDPSEVNVADWLLYVGVTKEQLESFKENVDYKRAIEYANLHFESLYRKKLTKDSKGAIFGLKNDMGMSDEKKTKVEMGGSLELALKTAKVKA